MCRFDDEVKGPRWSKKVRRADDSADQNLSGSCESLLDFLMSFYRRAIKQFLSVQRVCVCVYKLFSVSNNDVL